MPTPIYDTGDPGSVVGTPPPVTPGPGGGDGPQNGDGGGGSPGQPHRHRTQPKKTAARQNIAAWKPEDRPGAYKPATQAHPTAELTKRAAQHGGVVAEPEHAHRSTGPTWAPGKRTLIGRIGDGDQLSPKRSRDRPTTDRTLQIRRNHGAADGKHKGPLPSRRTIASAGAERHAPPTLRVTPVVHHLTITLGGKRYVNKPVKLSVNNKDQLIAQIGKTRIVIKPTATELRRVEKLQSVSVAGGKIAYPLLTVIAAKLANLPLSLVCAVMQRESYEGKNVWGDDPTIFASGGKPEAVTESQYSKYKKERGPENAEGFAPGKQQGVGPGQLTDAYLQDDADKLGGAWRPLPNMIIAFTHLKDVIAQHPGHLAAGLAAYNGPGEAAQKYAQIVLSNEREWAAALGVPSTRRG